MSHHVYKKIEVTGASDESVEAAVTEALQRTSKSVRNMRWFEVTEIRGKIEGNRVAAWQVTAKIGFDVED